jgi:hypothetical protein
MWNRRNRQDEERIRTYLAAQVSFTDTAPSLAARLGVSVGTARRVLDESAEAGFLTRRRFERGIEPIYYRYAAKAG